MCLGQEMYDLILCTYFPHEVTSSLAKAGHKEILKYYDIPIKYST
jgi:hypothetical protein